MASAMNDELNTSIISAASSISDHFDEAPIDEIDADKEAEYFNVHSHAVTFSQSNTISCDRSCMFQEPHKKMVKYGHCNSKLCKELDREGHSL